MRFSRVTVPTLKESPAEAEIACHELLLRAGMMRSVAAGIYTLLPLGALALEKIEGIVREEMNAAGALEVVLPSIHPKEAWEESGRWFEYGPEMMRLKDRQGRDFCLGPTAEEMITLAVARSAPSYRDLPVNLYQIQTKFRDETRPRFGLLRAREFRMKDAYSFHADEEDLDRTYRAMYGAYANVASRCSLDVRIVEASTGLIGGKTSHEFMVVSRVGEDVLVYCSGCEYGANAELETHRPGGRFGGDTPATLEEVHTPGQVSVSDVASFLGSARESVIKCVLYICGQEAVAVFVPGHREVSEPKLARILGTADFHPMRPDERELFASLAVGFVGPVGLEGARGVFDDEVKGARDLICGANRTDYHLRGVEEGREFVAETTYDVAGAIEGDLCVKCGAPLSIARGIEIGHIFKLGLKYSEVLKANFTDREGVLRPMVMGTYGIGTSRILATVVEQHHDDGGIKWPRAVAPVPVEIIVLSPGSAEHVDAASRIESGLAGRGIDALVDDREASPGVKFNDADLVGLPLQVVVGKKLGEKGVVDLKLRYDGERREVPLDGALQGIENALREAP